MKKKRKSTNTRKQPSSKLRWGLRIIAALIVLASMAGGGYALLKSSMFDLREVVFYGNHHLTEAGLLELMNVEGGENLLTLSSRTLYERLHKSPWVREVSMRKELPGKLVVRVKEATPRAIVDTGSSRAIVDGRGIVLEEVKESPEYFLPVIHSASMDESPEFVAALQLSERILSSGMMQDAHLVEITNLDQGVNHMVVRVDGMEVRVGSGSYDEKLTRLFELLGEIERRRIDVAYIDLRFENRVVVKPLSTKEVLQ